MSIAIKRVYEPATAQDGHRYLVDRLWPRGVSKAAAHLDAWLRHLAPSDALRHQYHHKPALFAEFRRRYLAELAPLLRELEPVIEQARTSAVTLVFAARDSEHSNAAVLRDLIQERIGSAGAPNHGTVRRVRARKT